jgi:hypothetical protein
LTGTDAIVRAFFHLPSPVTLRTAPAARIVVANGREALGSGPDLVRELFATVQRNARDSSRVPSTKNWRWEKQLDINPDNPSREKQLEKRVATVGGPMWANQIPTSSGLITSGERHRNIDLAHELPRPDYEFIELKEGSDTPFYAALEILASGLIFLYSRRHRSELGYREAANPLLWAETVHLRVLAPMAYYEPWPLGWLAPLLTEGLCALIDPEYDAGLAMDFGFDSWPRSFHWRRGEKHDEELIAALSARGEAYSTSSMS